MRFEVVDEEKKDFYLGDLTEREMELLDKVLRASGKVLRKYNKRIQETAELRGKECVDIVLRDGQVVPMLMSLLTKRFFIGDKPGLGKTVESAAAYANYIYQSIKRGLEYKKIIVVTDGQHVLGFANEWRSYGLDLIPLLDGSMKIERKLDRKDIEDYDGVIINWDGLKTNAFLEFYMENKDYFGYAVFDETSRLLNNTSMTYKVTNMIVNRYKGGIDRVIFLNGSSFEKNVFDFYNQFQVLKPRLIPNKAFLEDNYVIRGGVPVDFLRISGSRQRRRMVSRAVGEIIDYKNQSELRERLKYYYIARTKKDFSDELPKHSHRLHLINMTERQRRYMKKESRVTILNSPETVDEKYKLTRATTPKFKVVMDFIEQVVEDRPLIYVFNKKAQYTFKEELRKKGYKVEIINGNVKASDKTRIINKFNDYKLDMLILNVERAINLPTSDRILFYDILTMPQRTSQIKGRIDRDNYDTPKFYDFFCYVDSPEMHNIIKLAYFREKHGNKFTGQEDYTYKELIEQLVVNYGKASMDAIKAKVEENEDFFNEEDWEQVVTEILEGN